METVLKVEKGPEVIQVEGRNDYCPQCGAVIPAGSLEEHLPECPESGKAGQKVIVREIIREVPRYPDFPVRYPDTGRSRHRTTNGYTTSCGRVKCDITSSPSRRRFSASSWSR